jgi:hypothetical protein
VFDALGEWFATPTFRGCAFVNAHAELGRSNPAATQVVAGHKRALTTYLASLARRRRAVEPDELARELLLLVDGAIVTASILGDAGVARTARAAAAKLVAGHGVVAER